MTSDVLTMGRALSGVATDEGLAGTGPTVDAPWLEEGWRRVAWLDNAFEADFLTGALGAEGIEVRVQPHRDTAFEGLFLAQQSWGELWVRESNVAQATALVEAVRDNVAEDAPPPEAEPR